MYTCLQMQLQVLTTQYLWSHSQKVSEWLIWSGGGGINDSGPNAAFVRTFSFVSVCLYLSPLWLSYH
jgi:hypothetical protein